MVVPYSRILAPTGRGTSLSPRLVPPCTCPGCQTTGGLTLLYFLFRLVRFPCYRPLLVGPKSHLSSPSEEVSKVLSV